MELTNSPMKKGKSVEHLIMSKLLRNDFDVYVPLVDEKGIDIIVRDDKGRLVEVQVKGRTNCHKPDTVFSIKNFKQRDNFFICCHDIDNDIYWVIPSLIFERKGKVKEGTNITYMEASQVMKESNYRNDKGLKLLRKGFDYKKKEVK